MGAGEAGRTALATDRGGEDVWASATVALIIHTIFLELHAISNSLTDQLRECVDGASSHTSFSRQEHGTPAGLASSGDAPLLEGLQQLLAPFGANQRVPSRMVRQTPVFPVAVKTCTPPRP